ncbi:MAG: F0F1 ATP synthase subunit B' [Pseudomonadota bacterium]
MATADTGKAEGASGMPQLAFETFPNQIFWLMVALVAIFFVLSRVALPRIGSTIEERHDAIENDLERAAEYRRKAEEAEQAYDKALADARAEAQRIAGEAKAEIQKDVDAAIAKADEEIAAKSAESEARIREIRDSAMEAVETVAKDTAGAIVDAVLPAAKDADAVNAAVAAQLKS